MIGENDVSFSSGSMIPELKNESGIPEVVGAGPGGISIDSGKFADIWNPELLGKCVQTQTERQNTQQACSDWGKSDLHLLIVFFQFLPLQAFFSSLENKFQSPFPNFR